MSVVTLMYHALYASDAGRAALEPSDLPYAVSCDEFERQMRAIAELGIAVLDARTMARAPTGGAGVVITFDDGHASDRALALPMLRRHGFPATMFVTTDFIGRRPGYCTWDEVAELSQAGLAIGSHGKTHRFLSDLPPGELERELQDSSEAIRSCTGASPELLSFPGGRYSGESLRAAGRCGYRWAFSSIPGAHGTFPPAAGKPIRRLPVRASTSLDEFSRMVQGDARLMATERLKYEVKRMARTMIGNARYDKLYQRRAGSP